MQTPLNPFKQALAQRRPQIGFWLSLANGYTAEICAGAGFDWLLVDGEHAPNDVQALLAQAQAIAGYPATHAVARVPAGQGHAGEVLIKQYLDLGFQSLLVPMVDTPEQAAAAVRCMRYPPEGLRGAAGARAARWGRYANYAREANEQVCLLVQAESQEALAHLEAVAAVDGVDGIFIGPFDLAASMGHTGNPGHPEVQAAVDQAIVRVARTGKAAGIITPDEAKARHYLSLGATFVAVGMDTSLLARGTSALAARFKPAAAS